MGRSMDKDLKDIEQIIPKVNNKPYLVVSILSIIFFMIAILSVVPAIVIIVELSKLEYGGSGLLLLIPIFLTFITFISIITSTVLSLIAIIGYKKNSNKGIEIKKSRKVLHIVNCIQLIISVILIAIPIVLAFLSRVHNKEMTTKEKIIKEGLTYIEEKYDQNFEISSSGYVLINTTLFATYSKDIRIELTDGTKILYSAEEQKYYDDYQAEEISKALEEKIWNPMLEKLQPYYYENLSFEIIPSFNFYNEEGYSGNFFHIFYDGNIMSYVSEEDINVSIGYYDSYDNWVNTKLYIISEDENSWQNRFDIIEETLDTYFRTQPEYLLELVALTPDLYEKTVKNQENPKVNIGMDGCFATGNNKKLYLQKFIKISDGIYVTANASKVILEDGDITLKEVMTASELQNIMDNVVLKQESTDKNYMQNETYKYYINSLTPVYELEFSEKIQNAFKNYGADASISVYVKFVPEELNISKDNNLYSYPIRNGQYNYYQNYVVDKGNDEEAELDNWYIFKQQHKDYYWMGTQNFIKK